MPKSVNKVILVGNVGKDPEVKYTPSGVLRVSLLRSVALELCLDDNAMSPSPASQIAKLIIKG